MTVNYSEQLHNVLLYSSQEAERLGNNYVGPEHLLLGILRNGNGKAIDILNVSHVNLLKIKQIIESKIRTDLDPSGTEIPNLKSTERIKKIMELETRSLSAEIADTEHLLLAILKEKNNLAGDVLLAEHLTYDQVKAYIEEPKDIRMGSSFQDDDDEDDDPRSKRKSGPSSSGTKQSDTPALDTFGTDITKAALENRLDPIVGRNREIERLAQILSRRKKNNPVLIGDPGVGKSAIVEGLALRIIQRRVSRVLFDKRVVSLDMASIVAGTKYRGQFEERIKAILNELSKNPDVILFID